MKTIRFTYGYDYGLHRCTEPGDYSGEYVRAEVARELAEALRRLLVQAEMTSDYDESMDGTLRSACRQARAALAKAGANE